MRYAINCFFFVHFTQISNLPFFLDRGCVQNEANSVLKVMLFGPF